MKNVLISALIWAAAMMAALAGLDLLRGNPINWFVVIMAGVVFFGFKIINGMAHLKNESLKRAEKTDEDQE